MHAAQYFSLDAVRAAYDLIKPLVNRTPTLTSETLSHTASSTDISINFFIKCENLQKSGSFKYRGASNFIAQQSDEDLQKGVVAVSTGNFGLAVALAAKMASRSRSVPIQASVVLPSTSAPSKILGAKRNGATVVLAGKDPEDRALAAKNIQQNTGATFIGPMDDFKIVCGQGTVTLELIEQVYELSGQRLDAIVLPSATGGILSGAAIVCENTETMVFGCEPQDGGPNLMHGLKSGVLPNPTNQNTVADGLRASCSEGNFEIINQLVDGFYTATEQQIKKAWLILIDQLKLVVEPSSAVAVATILFNEDFRKMLGRRKTHWNIGIVLTGGNTSLTDILKEFSS